MAGIGKFIGNKDNSAPSPRGLKDELEKLQQQVVSIRAGKPINELDKKQKDSLRSIYIKMSSVARSLADLAHNAEEASEYGNIFEKCTSLAQKCGSSVIGMIPKTTWDDVKGMDEVKKLVKSFMFIAKNPEIRKYYKLEGGLGMLMFGAPGTGKTMFAEALANEMNLPLFKITPADIFKSYVGQSEQAVRDLFEDIDSCPDGAILFVDECESIFSKRTGDTKDYKAAVTTELLQRINGMGVDGSKRFMIAATNRPDMIDSAYLRYKRFSHLVHVTPPDQEAIGAIIRGKLNGIQLSGITVEEVIRMAGTPAAISSTSYIGGNEQGYYSAADICGVVEEASRIAMERIQASGSNVPIPLTRDMFELAFKSNKPSITASQLKEYYNFADSRTMNLD